MPTPAVDAVDIDPKTGTTLGFYTFGHDRPAVFIVAAMNGHASTCVYTAYLVMKHLRETERLIGSVTVVPVANPLAFRLGTHVSPLDSQDLDTTFPGDERGSVTQRTAWEIWRRATQADYVLHLVTKTSACVSHASGLHREYIHVRNLASQVALPVVTQGHGRRGALVTEAAHEGIPALQIVMRGGARDVDSQAAVEVREAVLNLMRALSVLPGQAMEVSSVFTRTSQVVNVDTEGFYVPVARPGEHVTAGEVIGRVEDRGEVMSPETGVLVSTSHMRYVFEGDEVARVAPPIVTREPYVTADSTPARPRRKW